MHIRSRTLLATLLALVLGAIAFSTSAEGYEGATWSIGETELAENHTVKTKSVGTITLEDNGLYRVECHVAGESKIGLYGKGEITALTFTECKAVSGCTGEVTLKAVHLPWHTQLEEIEEKSIRNVVSSSGAGAPGVSGECTVALLGKVKDECTGETSAELENVTGGADLIFEAKSAHLACSIGGAGAGIIKGTDLDENTTEQVRGDDRVDNLVGTTPLGAGKPLVFAAGVTTHLVILRNKAAIRRVYRNGSENIPGVVNVNPTNFTLMAFMAKPCGEGLAGGAECEIVVKSAKEKETGEYTFEYGNAGSPLINKFGLVAE
jgi:hypothetical protein